MRMDVIEYKVIFTDINGYFQVAIPTSFTKGTTRVSYTMNPSTPASISFIFASKILLMIIFDLETTKLVDRESKYC